MTYLLIFGAVVLLASLSALPFMIISTMKRKGNMGINLKITGCPKCNAEFPMVRRPANLRQALWGGNTCRHCGTEVDKWGRVIE